MSYAQAVSWLLPTGRIAPLTLHNLAKPCLLYKRFVLTARKQSSPVGNLPLIRHNTPVSETS